MTSPRLALGVAGYAELCHSRFLRQHRRPALRPASLLPLHRRSHRQSHWLREKPGELTYQCVPQFFPLRFVTWSPPGVLREQVVIRLYSCLAITPLLSFQHWLAPVPAPQIKSGSGSSPFSDLPWLLRLSQPPAQSHARTGSFPPRGDDRQKCPRRAARNRIRDSPELSLPRTPGHRLQ